MNVAVVGMIRRMICGTTNNCKDHFEIRSFTSFRPDKRWEMEKGQAFVNWILKLGKTVGYSIANFSN
jgi:glucuronate isomerase